MTASNNMSAIARVEQDMRNDLTRLYDKYYAKLKQFAESRIAQLQSDTKISSFDFAREIKALGEQSFIPEEQLEEESVFPPLQMKVWSDPDDAPSEEIINEVLIIIYKTYLKCMKKDSESEVMRCYAMKDVLDSISNESPELDLDD